MPTDRPKVPSDSSHLLNPRKKVPVDEWANFSQLPLLICYSVLTRIRSRSRGTVSGSVDLQSGIGRPVADDELYTVADVI